MTKDELLEKYNKLLLKFPKEINMTEKIIFDKFKEYIRNFIQDLTSLQEPTERVVEIKICDKIVELVFQESDVDYVSKSSAREIAEKVQELLANH